GQPILELEDDSFGRLLSDSGNGGEARQITPLDRADELERLDAGQHGEPELRSDAADTDQSLEEIELEHRGKAEQGNRILPHVRVDAERHFSAGVGKTIKRRQRHGDVISDAADIHYNAMGVLLEDGDAEVPDVRR